MLLVVGVDEVSVAIGGNGAALALLAAWAMRDVLGRRRAARTTPTCSACWRSPCCSCCCPLATDDAHALAGLGGGVAGIVMGLGLARLR